MTATKTRTTRLVNGLKEIQKKYRRGRGRLALEGHKAWHYGYKTADPDRIKLFGKRFLDTFPETTLKGKKRSKFLVSIGKSHYESNVSLGLEKWIAKQGQIVETSIPAKFAEAKLGFERNTVIIEALQGIKGWQPDLERFRQMHEKPWANYLIEKIEEHAKNTGFKKVKIRVPESLYWYWHLKPEKNKREIRKKMEALYNNAAKTMGYKRKGIFFIKNL